MQAYYAAARAVLRRVYLKPERQADIAFLSAPASRSPPDVLEWPAHRY